MPGTVRRWNYPPPLCVGMYSKTQLFHKYESDMKHALFEFITCILPLIIHLLKEHLCYKYWLGLFVSTLASKSVYYGLGCIMELSIESVLDPK